MIGGHGTGHMDDPSDKLRPGPGRHRLVAAVELGLVEPLAVGQGRDGGRRGSSLLDGAHGQALRAVSGRRSKTHPPEARRAASSARLATNAACSGVARPRSSTSRTPAKSFLKSAAGSSQSPGKTSER